MNARQIKSPVTAAAALLLLASPALCQITGTSHPETLNDPITTEAATQNTTRNAPHYVKPSPAIPLSSDPNTVAPTEADPVLQQHQPVPSYERTATSSYAPAPAEAPYVRREEAGFVVTDDPNSGVIIDVPTRPNELPIGALLHAQLVGPLSTGESRVGTRFAASLTQAVRHEGKVVLPQGTLVRGRVSAVHGGARISGAPSIRLRPETLLLPDGTTYQLAAQVIDLDHYMDSRVNTEGAIVANEHPKATLGVLGLTTGTAAVAGAAVGGGIGAVVGATVGAGVGTIWWLKKDRQESLPSGTEIVFSLDQPLNFETAQALVR